MGFSFENPAQDFDRTVRTPVELWLRTCINSFLRFLNEGLERYRDEPRVMQVSGHMFDVPSLAHQREALFLPMTTSWGWATWKRAWDLFDPQATGWHERLGTDVEAMRFNLDGRYDSFRMLNRQMNGEIDSWAIRWYYSLFARGGFACFRHERLSRTRA